MKQLFYIFLLFSICTTAQTDSLLKTFKKSTLYFEIGGQAGAYCVGYDRIVHIAPKKMNSLSVGVSYIPSNQITGEQYSVMSAAFSLNTVYSKHLELGIGLTPMIISEQGNYYDSHVQSGTFTKTTTVFFASPKIGYRYQQASGGFFFRASFIPMITLIKGSFFYRRIYPWVGFSLGHSF